MKIVNLSAAVAAMLVFPVVFCSCSTGSKVEKKAEPAPVPAKKAEPAPAPAPAKKAEPAPAPAPAKKAEPAPAPAPEKKAEPAPAPAPEKKAEPAPAPAPEKKKASSSRPVEHVVQSGDNLWKISKKYYGSGAKWKLIYEANKSAIKKQDFLEPGTVLAIPAAQ